MKDRSIVHLNVADFAVAVEQMVDRRLQDRPVVIAPDGAARAYVFDMSEEAYRAGIRKGMKVRQAWSLCRDLQVLPPHPERYERAMRALLTHARPYSPLIECADENGHLFIDLTGCGRLFGPPADVAWRIRKSVKADLGFDPIWSVAPNKMVAKVATRLVKPKGEYLVEPGEEEEFLQPLALRLMPGVEQQDLERLHSFHFRYVREVTALDMEQLQIAVGSPSHARHLHDIVRGIDPSPVLSVDQKRPVATAERAFGNDTHDRAVIESVLYALTESIGTTLRGRRLAARRLGLSLDYADGVRVTRSAALKNDATANDLRLFELARLALHRAWTRRVRIRHLSLTADRLIFPPTQLELFPDENNEKEHQDQIISTLDRIRRRFGHKAIRMGRCWAAGVE